MVRSILYIVGIRLSVPFGIQDGDFSASIITSKVENLLCCLIGLSDAFGCLSVLGADFSFPRCLGSGVLADMFLFGYGSVSQKSCLSFLSAFSCFFCFSFCVNVSDVSRCELADGSVDAAL